MEESDPLDALSNLLNILSTNPYDISLHAQHIQLATATGLEEQVDAAREMFTTFYAATDDIWIPLIEAKEKSVDLNSIEGMQAVLEVYSRAEADYLSIQIFRKHIEFLIGRHAYCVDAPNADGDLKEVCSTDLTLSAISAVVSKGAGHITQSHLLWDLQRDWELEVLEHAQGAERELFIGHIESLFRARLQQPHSNHEETFQSYSTFTTNYKSPQHYESLLISASKLRSRAVKTYEKRESFENSLAQSKYSLESYSSYIAAERRNKNPDEFVLTALYERAIAEAAKRRFAGEAHAEQALRLFWAGYCDFLRINDVEEGLQLQTLRRATRSVPGGGDIWARYLRFLEKMADDEDEEDIDVTSTVADVYANALSTNLIQKDVEQIIPVVLARAGCQKRQIASGKAEPESFSTLVDVLVEGIAMVRKATSTGDSALRLEKYLAELYVNLAVLPERAAAVWEAATKHYKTSYLAWTSYADALIKHDQHDKARMVYMDVSTKNLDWPEAVWQAWLSFEHLYGSVEELERCMDKIERAQSQVNARRAREAEKASYQAFQVAAEQQAATVPVQELPSHADSTIAMDVDVQTSAGSGVKRKAEESPAPEGHKKAKTESKQPTLKRDRENCTVFVSDLPADTTEDDLRSLFKDCGEIREIKVTHLPNAMVATVEFSERDSVPAALTKDKKRIHGAEIAVNMAWQSTLYVANFPETADDAFMRNLFGKYGLIFDVRWPSKKFKNTRRFVYVQYVSPSSAKAALELHGQEVEPGYSMNVYISNPERRKERTDADADAREIYVAGLSKFATKEDLEKLFRTYGPLKDVRMALDKDGKPKGFAFVEFEQEKDAQVALSANNHELKNRRIAVTLADTRVRARNKSQEPETSRRAEVRSRSLRIRNLPPGTQEGLLQQALEKLSAHIKRVEVFAKLDEAVVELDNPAEAGRILLWEQIMFDGKALQISEERASSASRPPNKAGGLFVPRGAVSRPRAGLGKERKKQSHPSKSAVAFSEAEGSSGKDGAQGKRGQDDFRKMLGGH